MKTNVSFMVVDLGEKHPGIYSFICFSLCVPFQFRFSFTILCVALKKQSSNVQHIRIAHFRLPIASFAILLSKTGI